jgi:hypothetical protein
MSCTCLQESGDETDDHEQTTDLGRGSSTGEDWTGGVSDTSAGWEVRSGSDGASSRWVDGSRRSRSWVDCDHAGVGGWHAGGNRLSAEYTRRDRNAYGRADGASSGWVDGCTGRSGWVDWPRRGRG